jgi:hypothetical protein
MAKGTRTSELIPKVFAENNPGEVQKPILCMLKRKLMKHSIFSLTILSIFIWSPCLAQDLKIGVGGGALFMQGQGFFGSDSYENSVGFGTTYSLGGEIEYSLPALPINLVGQLYYAPASGEGRRNSSDGMVDPFGHRRNESSFFSGGLGVRWVPLRGLFSPYVGTGLLLSYLDAGRSSLGLPESLNELDGSTQSPDRMSERRRNNGITRLGIGFNAGSEFSLSPLLDLDVGANYGLNGISGRRGEPNLNTIGFGATLLFKVF